LVGAGRPSAEASSSLFAGGVSSHTSSFHRRPKPPGEGEGDTGPGSFFLAGGGGAPGAPRPPGVFFPQAFAQPGKKKKGGGPATRGDVGGEAWNLLGEPGVLDGRGAGGGAGGGPRGGFFLGGAPRWGGHVFVFRFVKRGGGDRGPFGARNPAGSGSRNTPFFYQFFFFLLFFFKKPTVQAGGKGFGAGRRGGFCGGPLRWGHGKKMGFEKKLCPGIVLIFFWEG